MCSDAIRSHHGAVPILSGMLQGGARRGECGGVAVEEVEELRESEKKRRQAGMSRESRDLHLDHAKLDVVIDAAHQAEVKDGQPTIRGANQISWVRVSLQRSPTMVTKSISLDQSPPP